MDIRKKLRENFVTVFYHDQDTELAPMSTLVQDDRLVRNCTLDEIMLTFSFEPVSVDDVVTLVKQMHFKTCSIDPMPTNVVSLGPDLGKDCEHFGQACSQMTNCWTGSVTFFVLQYLSIAVCSQHFQCNCSSKFLRILLNEYFWMEDSRKYYKNEETSWNILVFGKFQN